MKKVALLAVIALLAAALVVQAQIKDEYWENVPGSQKTEISVYDYGRSLSIQIFFSTLENWKLFWGNQWANQQKPIELIQKTLETVFPKRVVLFVCVGNGSKSQYFFPTNFAFTQGTNQYSVEYNAVLPLSKDDPFAGGEMKPYIITEGFIAIPEGVDVTKPFKIWYGDDYGVIKSGANSR